MSEHAREALPVVVIGGGAAGFFAAIRLAELLPGRRVLLLEATRKVLTKVRLSGGGRCNVTHHCFDPAKLIDNYPRGSRELRGAFMRFQPRDTVAWFKARGIDLKTESDGRMFPVSDRSEDVARCLEDSAKRAGVEVRLGAIVVDAAKRGSGARGLQLTLKDGGGITASAVLLATGSAPAGLQLATKLGHQIAPHVPSLFTFNVRDPRLSDLAGVACAEVQLTLSFAESKDRFVRTGPLLVTHWGLSGPAVLKLSAFAAERLHATGYQAELTINFLPGCSQAEVAAAVQQSRQQVGKKAVAKHPLFAQLPRRWWQRLCEHVGIGEEQTFAELPKGAATRLIQELTAARYRVVGKGVFKDEFVSAGGVVLAEVDFRTMASRVQQGLYLAGEVLALDGITGGFNFQAAWTTAWLAAEAMALA